MKEQEKMIEYLEHAGKSKHLANRILYICDDLVGSSLFGNQRDNLFKGLNTRHRHYNMSILMVAQGYKEVPRTIRTNWTALICFDIANDKEREVIYEENTAGLDRNSWEQAYKYCTRGKYDFMYINSKMERGERMWKNFEEMVFFKPTEENQESPDVQNAQFGGAPPPYKKIKI